eukprot:gb/GEZN01016714.1/.p1 GENE.gb/GEZN01016714.1/~~gb/GEZN01016714.1/.p1  ORF type:complete len:155 (+),score=25.10 gb/GEZN01016714.1/:126-590(+)
MSSPAHPLMKEGGLFEQKQFAFKLDGVRTEVVLTPFKDKVFIIITQNKKMGSLLQARTESILSGLPEDRTYHVQTLLGRRDDPLLTLCARRLIQNMAESGCNKSLLLSMSLLPPSKPARSSCVADWEDGAGAMQGSVLPLVKLLVQTILNHKVW